MRLLETFGILVVAMGLLACTAEEERSTEDTETTVDASSDTSGEEDTEMTTDAAPDTLDTPDTQDALGEEDTEMTTDAAPDAPDASGDSCPAVAPSGGACEAGQSCTYGEECCCGGCYDSIVCSCSGGAWHCLETDACYMPLCTAYCDTISTVHEALLEGARTCGVAADCQVLSDSCGVGLGGCYAIVNTSITQSELWALSSDWSDSRCDLGAPVCDCAPAPAIGCVDGLCGPAPDLPCTSSADCAQTDYCDFTEDFCGAVGFMSGRGTCAPRPSGCAPGGVGVCGCDGSTPFNACDAASGGHDVSRFGGCADGLGGFDCGGLASCATNQYCSISMNDTPGPEFFASCVDLPVGCDLSAPDCSCLPASDFATCNDSTGAIVVVYPGG